MEIINRPPIDDEGECGYLNDNFLTCLREKSLKDNVPRMECEVEKILWFMVECPTKLSRYTDAKQLRKTFIQQKLQEENNKNTKVLKK